jgi:hypothetical protein
MDLNEGQLQDISQVVADLNTQRTLDKALKRTETAPVAGYTGSVGKESYVYGTLSVTNRSVKGFQFLSALIAEIGVNPTTTARLQAVLRGTPLTVEVRDGKHVLLESGESAPSSTSTAAAQTTTSTPARVFISHRGANEITEFLAACLVRHLGERIRPWLDHKISGGRWRPQIAANLATTDAIVVLGTPGILRSTFVGYEIGYSDERLADGRIFLLRAGLSNDQLKDCRPLDEFQSFEAAVATSLRDFIEKLAKELEIGPISLDPAAIAQDAATFGRLTAEESTRHPADLAATSSSSVDRILEELEASMKLARFHSLQGASSAMEPEMTSFDVQALRDVRDELFPSMTPQCRQAVQTAIERLRHANDQLAQALKEDRPGQPPGPHRKSMISASRNLRDPLIQAHALVLIAYGRPRRDQYWQW